MKSILIERIEKGRYAEGEKLKPQLELAKELNTSIATCSKVINELVKENILETKKGVGTFVVPRDSINRKKILEIHFLVPTINNSYFSTFMHHLANSVADIDNIKVRLHITNFDKDTESKLIEKLQEDPQSYGFLSGIRSEKSKELIKNKCEKFFLFGPAPELTGKTNIIFTDFEKGGYLATNFLINKGHHKVAFVGGIEEILPGRFSGYKKALRKHGIPLNNKIIIPIEGFEEKGHQEKEGSIKDVLDYLLSLSTSPTAIFCCSDNIAMYFLISCERRGIDVPHTLSICGFDGVIDEFTNLFQITTVRQPYEKLIEKAISFIINGGDQKPIFSKIPPTLIIGNTVRDIRGEGIKRGRNG